MLFQPKQLILIIGRKGSGKDALADVFEYKAKTEVIRESFAKPLKETLQTLFGLSDDSFFYDQLKKEKPLPNFSFTPRDAMCWLGKAVKEKFGEMFWIDSLINRIKHEKHKTILITDCRFPEEVECLYNFYPEAQIIYIDAEKRLGPLLGDSDCSEKSVLRSKTFLMESNIPFIEIQNNGTFEDYYTKCLEICNNILKN